MFEQANHTIIWLTGFSKKGVLAPVFYGDLVYKLENLMLVINSKT